MDPSPPIGHSDCIKLILLSLKFLFNANGPALHSNTIANQLCVLFMW